ncbi:MAG: amidohydrolase [Bacteroidales bacterium]|nr:amidohydrolase [Bacteroidales bacterium]
MEKLLALVLLILIMPKVNGQRDNLNGKILELIDNETDRYRNVYKDLHQHPELSNMEFETSKKMAEELKSIGFDVTTGVGGNGVVGIFKNGEGKIIMLRTDMDALPIKENTGADFASCVTMKDHYGNESPVMHACGHDLHMTTWMGTLRTLVALRNEWKGTIMAVAQPAEELTAGADEMINDGLFKKFPVPDFALCYHVSPELAAGTIGYYPGPIFAGVKSAQITVYGIGGHGAMPQKSIDPVVLAAKIILDIQTIVSRRINPVKPAVVTVGSIHGGSRDNIIPDDVRMLLTIRFFEDEVFKTIKESILNITRGDAIAAGLPESKMPLVVFDSSDVPPVTNNRDLVLKSVVSMKSLLGENNVILVDPLTTAEDFGKYGLTKEKIPIALFWLGGVNRSKYLEHIEKGTYLPYLHNSAFAPDFDPAFKCGVTAMTRTLIDLFRDKK